MKTLNWNNSWNWKYYEKMPHNILKKWLRIKGLKSNSDLVELEKSLFDNYFQNNDVTNIRFLEIGGGLGRTIDWLKKKYPKSYIDSVEITKNYFQFLRKKFLNSKKVTIIKSSIQDYSPRNKYDIILWLWAGILEMPPEEKKLTISKLKKMLKPNGSIVIEMPKQIIGESDKISGKIGFGKVSEKHGDLFFHLISEKELFKITKQVKLKLKQVINYKTKTNNRRNLYIFERSK